MHRIDKRQANAYDRMIDAAADLADLIEESRIEIDEYALEELTIFLANNAGHVKKIIRNLKYIWP
ncbi:MAG: YebG family protein [Desulfobacteraceae bacterium]|jgi:dsDNA-binding SOS-regulon protein